MSQQPAPAPKPTASPRVAVAAALALVVGLTGVCVGTAPLRRKYGIVTQTEHMAAQHAARGEIDARSQRLLAQIPADGERAYVRESCAQVTDMFSVRSDLGSEARDARFAERYRGRWVRWAASANQTIPVGGGRYQVQFKCSEHSILYDGTVLFDEGAGVSDLVKDQVFSFEAELLTQNSVLGVQLLHGRALPE